MVASLWSELENGVENPQSSMSYIVVKNLFRNCCLPDEMSDAYLLNLWPGDTGLVVFICLNLCSITFDIRLKWVEFCGRVTLLYIVRNTGKPLITDKFFTSKSGLPMIQIYFAKWNSNSISGEDENSMPSALSTGRQRPLELIPIGINISPRCLKLFDRKSCMIYMWNPCGQWRHLFIVMGCIWDSKLSPGNHLDFVI